jgi:FAD/FMN-containing dehydrogenase
MELVFGVEELDTMRAVRTSTDRAGLANPGKLLPEGHVGETA